MFGLKGYLAAGIVLLALFFLWGIARNWSCRRFPEPDTDRLGPFAVVAVPNGASVEVKKGRRRTEVLLLEGVAAPAMGQVWFEESQAGLAAAAGSSVTVEVQGRRRDRDQVGVFGESGQCLQVEQLAAGLAWLTAEKPAADWKAAEAAAKKGKKGIWGGP